MMREAILSLPQQFSYDPKVENTADFGKHKRFIVCGMGGSHLAAGVLKLLKPDLPLVIHRDYGLPNLPAKDLKESVVIASSYSGNTEETVDAFAQAQKKNLAAIAVSTGGKLLEMAIKNSLPYVELPNTGIQPRSAIGFSLRALLKIIGDRKLVEETAELAHSLAPADFEENGKLLAQKLNGFIPVVYASKQNKALAHNWKIRFNETAKTPAFYNLFPEVNHNEMIGFGGGGSAGELSKKFHFIFLKDGGDSQKIQKRMDVMEKLFRERELSVEVVRMNGTSLAHKVFCSIVLADWTAYYLAEAYGIDPEQVEMVEEFKKMIG